MSHCICCGLHVPDGQRVCSMCYGDIDYGRDGYYREWAEVQEERDAERRHIEERETEEDPHR